FFFSSRRRHTRFSRDWSSDVCSSDLRPRWWSWAWAVADGTGSGDGADGADGAGGAGGAGGAAAGRRGRLARSSGVTVDHSPGAQIGRASCREVVSIIAVAVDAPKQQE